jgi:hypothetical protein
MDDMTPFTYLTCFKANIKLDVRQILSSVSYIHTSGSHCLLKLSLLQCVDKVDIMVWINLLEVVIETCLAVGVHVAFVAASDLLKIGPELTVSIAHGTGEVST